MQYDTPSWLRVRFFCTDSSLAFGQHSNRFLALFDFGLKLLCFASARSQAVQHRALRQSSSRIANVICSREPRIAGGACFNAKRGRTPDDWYGLAHEKRVRCLAVASGRANRHLESEAVSGENGVFFLS